MAGYDAFWVLPEVIKSGSAEEIEQFPNIDIEYGVARDFLDFDEEERNITTDGLLLTIAYKGLHTLNITITDQSGNDNVYEWELLVLSPPWLLSIPNDVIDDTNSDEEVDCEMCGISTVEEVKKTLNEELYDIYKIDQRSVTFMSDDNFVQLTLSDVDDLGQFSI